MSAGGALLAALLYPGVPLFWSVWFTLTLVIVIYQFCWKIFLFRRSRRWQKRLLALGRDEGGEASRDQFYWVFMVPALNEEVTIIDSIERLEQIEAKYKRIIVIDDGSEDQTSELLAAQNRPNLQVVSRLLPDAQKGKAAALNAGFIDLLKTVEELGWPRERVIVTIVDADGRIDADGPRYVGQHFEDPRVGGVQMLVRIYNLRGALTWAQNREFKTFGYLYQAARSSWGGAYMGGNGQMNRLTALEQVATPEGPWRDRLTEDQDIGLRLLANGWLGRQELRAQISQQGLNSLRALIRQRVRWSMGNLQTLSMTGALVRGKIPLVGRAEIVNFLFMPFMQAVAGVASLGALYVLVSGSVELIPNGETSEAAIVVATAYILSVGGVVLASLADAHHRGPVAYLRSFAEANLFIIYTWLMWPVLMIASYRILRHQTGWAKTDRESLEPPSSATPSSR